MIKSVAPYIGKYKKYTVIASFLTTLGIIANMEEIIGFKLFLRQNESELQKRFPFILRHYIPAYITSLICLPINTLIICKCILCIEDSALFAGAFMALGAILVFVNIFIAQKLMGWFTKKTQK